MKQLDYLSTYNEKLQEYPLQALPMTVIENNLFPGKYAFMFGSTGLMITKSAVTGYTSGSFRSWTLDFVPNGTTDYYPEFADTNKVAYAVGFLGLIDWYKRLIDKPNMNLPPNFLYVGNPRFHNFSLKVLGQENINLQQVFETSEGTKYQALINMHSLKSDSYTIQTLQQYAQYQNQVYMHAPWLDGSYSIVMDKEKFAES